MPERPRFSIVIVTFGNREVTERCLESLDAAFGSRLGDDVELVLVDNASPDDTPALLRSWDDRATVILLDENRNYAGGNNAGARAATGEVLVVLNNDTEVQPGALDALAEEALEPGVGISGCRLLYPDGTIQHGGCAWWREPEGRVLPFHLFQFEPGDLPPACATFDCDVVTGACLAIRRALFLELGGFDEAYKNGLEDVDLCVRVRLTGKRVVYRGDIAIVHAEGATRSRSPNDVENQRLFVSRYHALTDEDTERLSAQFDATGPNFCALMYPGELPAGTAISVEGEVAGLPGESAEARALLTALEAAGLAPATRDWHPSYLTARLTDAELGPVQRGRLRPKRHGALVVQVPVAPAGPVDVHNRAVVRLATMPSADLSEAAAVWAAFPVLADELIAAGVRADRVEVLPPLIPDVPLGSGRGGVLALLPAHDAAACATVLAALSRLASQAPIRLLPSVATEPLASLVESLLPEAELLAPISSDERFASLAGECDVVVHVDRRDPFERRALIAAAAGAASVHLPGGAAASVLGEELAYDGSAEALRAALACAQTRAGRARTVREACGEEALLGYLRELVERAHRQRSSRAVALG